MIPKTILSCINMINQDQLTQTQTQPHLTAPNYGIDCGPREHAVCGAFCVILDINWLACFTFMK